MKKLNPFKLCVLQNFPFIEQDFDALTNYELLCKVVEFLNKTIDSQNEVIEEFGLLHNAFLELKDYVDDYLKNHLKEDVDAKLDEMSEDGTLETLISKYIDNNLKRIYNSLELLKQADLSENIKVQTLGYYSINDGGGANYVIRNVAPQTYYETLDNGKFAELVDVNTIYPEIFGAKGDNQTDDTQSFINLINYCKTKKININLKTKKYKVHELLLDNIFNIKINGNNATLIYNGNKERQEDNIYLSYVIKLNNCDNVLIDNLNLEGLLFNGNNININTIGTTTETIYNDIKNAYTVNHRGLFVYNSHNITIENINSTDFYENIRLYGSNNITVDNCLLKNSSFGIQGILNNNVLINNVKCYDIRYRLFLSETSKTNSIGATGSGFYFENTKDLIIQDCYCENVATDCFRVQENSTAKIINCKTFRARRNAFSVYQGEEDIHSEVEFINCIAKSTGDVSFWSGSDYINTFKRPAEKDEPRSFTTSDNTKNCIVKFINCIVDGIEYTNFPSHQGSSSDIYCAVAEGNFLLSNQQGTSTYDESKDNDITIINCNFKGSTTKDAIKVYGKLVCHDNKIKMKVADSSDRIVGIVSYNSAKIYNNTILYGRNSITVYNGDHEIINNKCIEPYLTGIICQETSAGKSITKTIKNNIIKNYNTSNTESGNAFNIAKGKNIILNDNELINTSDTTINGTGIIIPSGITNLYYKNNVAVGSIKTLKNISGTINILNEI